MRRLQALLKGISSDIADTIAAKDAQLLADYPVATYIRYFDEAPADASYSSIPAPVDEIYESIKTRGDEDIVQNYNKIVLTEFMSQYYSRVEKRKLTPQVEEYFREYYKILVDRIKNPRTSYFRLSNSAFEKDLAVCRMKLWPCGAELIDEKAGFPRSLLLTQGVRQAAKGWSFFRRAKGFAPFFETHFDRRFVQDFSPEGYRRLYRTIAELLEVNQHIKGVIGGSWWHDPALREISPDIWFLTEIPLTGGAALFRAPTDEVAVRDATRWSVTRNSLFKEGRYSPAVHVLVWLRDDLMRWAKELDAPT